MAATSSRGSSSRTSNRARASSNGSSAAKNTSSASKRSSSSRGRQANGSSGARKRTASASRKTNSRRSSAAAKTSGATKKASSATKNAASKATDAVSSDNHSALTNFGIPAAAATVGAAAGVLLGRSTLQRTRKVLGVRVPAKPVKVDLGDVTKHIGEAGRQFGKLASEVRAVREKAEQVGRVIS